MKEALGFRRCVVLVVPKNDERNDNDFREEEDEEEETEEEEHVVGFIIIALGRRQTKCLLCVFLCGNSDARLFKNLPKTQKTPEIFPLSSSIKNAR